MMRLEGGKSAFRQRRRWTNAKAALKPFAEVANDGDDEGMHFIVRVPSIEEAATIRPLLSASPRGGSCPRPSLLTSPSGLAPAVAALRRAKKTESGRCGGYPTCPPTPPKGNFDDAAFRLGRIPSTSSAYGEKKTIDPAARHRVHPRVLCRSARWDIGAARVSCRRAGSRACDIRWSGQSAHGSRLSSTGRPGACWRRRSRSACRAANGPRGSILSAKSSKIGSVASEPESGSSVGRCPRTNSQVRSASS